MTPMPYYVSPDQMMKDRADYARKGIGRGKSIVALECELGILITAENLSNSLYKISEIYDRIAFAAVGKYNEFENLRTAGVKLADMRGYAYGREDVNARAIANAYAQTLGAIFTQEMKPFEVEILVAEVGLSSGDDEMYRITYDGTLRDERGFVAMGGHEELLTAALKEQYTDGLTLNAAVRLAAQALAAADTEREVKAENLEVALLDRARPRRSFRRLRDPEVAGILQGDA